MEFTRVKLEIFIPETHVDGLREALAEAGAGRIGNYDHCCSNHAGKGILASVGWREPV